ncbi:hypothetical protein SADUNF_Sadunf06G0139200 [Salix dunnii]|uniref:IBH1-like N-terminal domain-containing protein n=1 Tax=Salix dunnii TaxID=1413687 RepID=A0A835K783_9ROSI|nr:hypothetical protein SADUNF_Sadunf06G0139200 [Salix dunnii]
MRAPRSVLRQQFLKKWIMGLQVFGSAKQNMSILERKKAIKLSADIALASTRDGRTCWSRALIASASKDDDSKVLVQHLLAPESERLKKASVGLFMENKRVRCKKILKRSCCIKRVRKGASKVVVAKSISKRIVRRRTQVLKSIVPGGEFMDDISLIEETLDYIVSLQAQVDGMRSLAKATEVVNGCAQYSNKDKDSSARKESKSTISVREHDYMRKLVDNPYLIHKENGKE